MAGFFNKKFILFLGLFLLVTATFYFVKPVSFNSSQVTLIFSLIILFITLFSIFFTNYELAKKEKILNNSIKFLKKINKKLENNETQIEEEFNNIKKHFSNTFLDNVWKKYEKSIRRINIGINQSGEIQEKLFATIEAENYFDKNIITKDRFFNLQIYFPHMLVSLGILGTFLGIVIGLHQIDLNSDIQTIKSSIDNLLNGVQVSFRTSLYGISYSIFLTLYQKIYFNMIEKKIYDLSEEINLLFPLNTQEDGIKEIHIELEKQTSSIQRLASDFAEEIGTKFDKSFQNNLAPTMDKLTQSMEDLIKISQETNNNAIDSIVNNVGDILTSTANTELNNLKSVLISLNEKNVELLNKFESVFNKIDTNINNFEKATDAVNKNFLDIIETLESDYTKLRLSLQEMSKNLDESIDRLSSDVFNVLAEISKEYSNIATSLSSFSKDAEGFTNKFDDFIIAQESTQVLWNKYNESFKELTTFIESGLANYTNNVKSGLELVFEQYDKHITDVLSKFNDTIENFGSEIEEFKDIIGEKLALLRGELKD